MVNGCDNVDSKFALTVVSSYIGRSLGLGVRKSVCSFLSSNGKTDRRS